MKRWKKIMALCFAFLMSFVMLGSSGEAALILKRNFIGSEINADYFQISNERLSLHGEQKNEL